MLEQKRRCKSGSSTTSSTEKTHEHLSKIGAHRKIANLPTAPFEILARFRDRPVPVATQPSMSLSPLTEAELADGAGHDVNLGFLLRIESFAEDVVAPLPMRQPAFRSALRRSSSVLQVLAGSTVWSRAQCGRPS